MDRVRRMVHYPTGQNIRGNGGEGVTVAVLDTGLAPHPDFRGRINGFLDFVNHRQQLYDDSGHGTHVSGILLGDGRMSRGILAGIAPKAGILAVKVLDHRGEGSVDSISQGIEWICRNHRHYGIRVANLSVGASSTLKSCKEQELIEAVELLWDEGVAVVVSAGNAGPGEGTVAVPGTSRKVITVGMLKTEQGMHECSGRGPTKECIIKPDLMAPGYQVISCNAVSKENRRPYVVRSGTSMATPVVAGAAALYLAAYPEAGNVELKLKLRESCIRTNPEQGWGCLDVSALLS